ncbi:MAG: hypothetical protein Tsb009_25210 [Planctomycetaceae bacterium]
MWKSKFFKSLTSLKRHETKLLLATLVVIIATAFLDTGHNYINDFEGSARKITRDTALLGIFALGAAIVIISGGIDLSSGSVIAFSSTVCACLLLMLAPEQMENGEPLGADVIALAILGTLFAGFLIGSLHAWLISSVGLPPFVATLATLVGLRSLARAMIESVTESVRGNIATRINVNDEIFRSFGWDVWIPATTFLVLAVVCWILLSRTVVGRHLYAMGGNEEAARLSGIRTDRLKWLAYCISAMLSSVAGILFLSYESEANPQSQGVGYELNAIAVAVVGGCSLQGGLGTIPGTCLGTLFLQAVFDSIARIVKKGSDIYQGLIVGVVVVFAVAFSQMEAGTRRRKFFSGGLGIVAILNLSILAGVLASLLGPRLLQGKTQLDGKYLFGLIAVGVALLLSVLRLDLSLRRKRILGAVLAVGWIGTTVYLDQNLPMMRYQAAIRVVENAGGTVRKVDDGTLVDFTDQNLDDADLTPVFVELRNITDLTELRLTRTKITDDGLEVLGRELGRSQTPSLRRLHLTGTATKKTGERAVERAVPDLEIIR